LPRQAEVGDLHLSIVGQKNVSRLDVAVNDALLVRRFEPVGALFEYGQYDFGRKLGNLVQDTAQIRARYVFHDDVIDVVLAAEVDDRDNVWMAQRGCGARFALESGDEIFVIGQSGMQKLDGDRAPERSLDALVQRGHSARADLLFDFVTAK
jgi:hypothetical protein